MPVAEIAEALVRERRENRVADPALDPVILHHHDASARGARRIGEGLRVDRLHRVEVDDPDRDVLMRKNVDRLERFVHGDARGDDRRTVLARAATHDLAAADREALALVVDDRGLLPRGPEIRDPFAIRHLRHELRGLIPIGGVEHRAAVDRAHHREVLEAHLRGTVLADRNAGVRTDQANLRARDRRHADEVVRAREERGEGRGERDEAHDLHAYSGSDHLLLGDVHLEEPLGRRLLEVLGMRRVRDLGVEDDHVFSCGSERGQRLAVRLSRRDRLGVRLERERSGPLQRRPFPWFGLLDGESAGPELTAKLGDRLLRLLGIERLAVPAFLVLEERDALALHGAGEHGGRAAGAASARVRVVDLGEVVTVDDDRIHIEGANARGVRAHVPLELGRPTLSEAVHIDDRGEVRKALVTRVVECLPYRALGRLAVAHEHPDVIRRLEHALAGESDANSDRQPLSERPGRHVDPREDRRGMPLESTAEPPEGHELVVVDRARRLEHRVDEWRGMTLREDEVVVGRIVRMPEVVAQMPGKQDSDEVSRGE